MRAASLDKEVGVRRGYHCTTNIFIMCLHVTVWFLDAQTKFFSLFNTHNGCALAALIHHTVLL